MTLEPGGTPRPVSSSSAPARPVLRSTPSAASGAPVPVPQSALTAPDNRRSLLLLSVPLLAATALCLFSYVKREALDPLLDPPFGAMSRSQARRVAGALCTRLTGEAARPTDASRQAAFSCRRGRLVREWEVVCDTADGQYLLRLNADSGTVYAVNRLQDRRPAAPRAGAYAIGSPADGSAAAAATPPASEAEEEARLSAGVGGAAAGPLLTRAQAEARARGYLSLIGVPADGLHTVGTPGLVSDNGAVEDLPAEDDVAPTCTTASGSCLWNFTFRRRVPGLGERLVKVTVDGRDGELEHVWNPVSAL